MEIYRVDPRFRKRVGNNLLVNGQARILHDKQAVYAVVVHNDSDLDLWPYLAYMDTNGFGINLLYHPEPTSTPPPLRRHSFLEIGCGSGNAMSDPLSFPLPEHQQEDSGFLKLFVSTTYTSMGLLEQGSSSLLGVESSVTPRPATPLRQDETRTQKWDTALACLTLTQSMRQGKRVD
ncbi:hypothetical protein SERLA73DRAFT_180528 [Serpula lacrymans var. lacrymans S7.3]|uniref:Uncharacterized protein n=2 Tax=Serpula lacrymans var. lacrymans TaxID=341189 RepID=F8PV20_SERL3|nr:uncharacterized protein SERLADRAFT_466168 [Serpula lacrymans var. lacrymans S7.9]EGO00100.1 hypothetical protein SERLA73DRAFT_180528 [Serpula lacrymans var. lacrymans S7.3]EGO25661.1 hypothetical protein SERLADRAFT_466168 [Serpula lacrymans var. lacrymans S7.9]